MWSINNQYKVTIIEDYCTRYLTVLMYISFLHFALIGYSIIIFVLGLFINSSFVKMERFCWLFISQLKPFCGCWVAQVMGAMRGTEILNSLGPWVPSAVWGSL